MPLTEGQQRACLLGDLASYVCVCQSAKQDGHLPPQSQFALCQTGWSREGLCGAAGPGHSAPPPCPGSPCYLLLTLLALILWARLPGCPPAASLIWTHGMNPYPSLDPQPWSCWPLRLRLGSVKLHIY